MEGSMRDFAYESRESELVTHHLLKYVSHLRATNFKIRISFMSFSYFF